jgi:hypothetical protein
MPLGPGTAAGDAAVKGTRQPLVPRTVSTPHLALPTTSFLPPQSVNKGIKGSLR